MIWIPPSHVEGAPQKHRRRIYDKFDITTERELFLKFSRHRAG